MNLGEPTRSIMPRETSIIPTKQATTIMMISMRRMVLQEASNRSSSFDIMRLSSISSTPMMMIFLGAWTKVKLTII